MITRRRLRGTKWGDITGDLTAAFKRGQSARDRGEPISECHENPMSKGMQESWKRGWRTRDRELGECQTSNTSKS